MLNLAWVLPFIPLHGHVQDAWRLAGIFLPMSLGWAAGDISLAAYIQSAVSLTVSFSSARVLRDYCY
jgi:hypothetical protein